MKIPKGVKFKTPPRETEELGRFYDLVFDYNTFYASWCGGVGHYAYTTPDKPWRAADDQDGYIYLWPTSRHSIAGDWVSWEMSADPRIAASMCREYVEINT